VFPGQAHEGFWMKDTLIPLDIAFIALDTVAEIDSMTPCRADPCPITRPRVFYDRALEVPAGTFAKGGITVGASAVPDRSLPAAS
jgi:uncharacterized protein